MPEVPRLVRSGNIGASPINSDVRSLGSDIAVPVRLLADYVTAQSVGMPTRPSMTGAASANLDYPRTIPAGSILTVLRAEADALVAAGKAAAGYDLEVETGDTLTTQTTDPVSTEAP